MREQAMFLHDVHRLFLHLQRNAHLSSHGLEGTIETLEIVVCCVARDSQRQVIR